MCNVGGKLCIMHNECGAAWHGAVKVCRISMILYVLVEFVKADPRLLSFVLAFVNRTDKLLVRKMNQFMTLELVLTCKDLSFTFTARMVASWSSSDRSTEMVSFLSYKGSQDKQNLLHK